MTRRIASLLLAATLLITAPALAGTITVDRTGSGDYETIQECLDVADGGDTVLVAPGEYLGVDNRDLDFRGVGITLVGQAGASSTTIDMNAGGDSLPGDSGDNLFTDPLLCDVYHDDFTLCENSPCVADNNAWGEPVGAHGIGCGNCDSPVEAMSWGGDQRAVSIVWNSRRVRREGSPA
jgi:hypothetical protein